MILHNLKSAALLDPTFLLLKEGMVSLFDPLGICPKLDVVPLDFAVPVFYGEPTQKVLAASLLLGIAELLREYEHLEELPLGQVNILMGGFQELTVRPLALLQVRGVDGTELGLSLEKCEFKALLYVAHIFIRNGVMGVIG